MCSNLPFVWVRDSGFLIKFENEISTTVLTSRVWERKEKWNVAFQTSVGPMGRARGVQWAPRHTPLVICRWEYKYETWDHCVCHLRGPFLPAFGNLREQKGQRKIALDEDARYYHSQFLRPRDINILLLRLFFITGYVPGWQLVLLLSALKSFYFYFLLLFR